MYHISLERGSNSVCLRLADLYFFLPVCKGIKMIAKSFEFTWSSWLNNYSITQYLHVKNITLERLQFSNMATEIIQLK